MGLCPFHKDTNPSLSIDVVKNEWHCFGCDCKGDVIEWVRCAEGVSFTHALELLQRDYLPSAITSVGPPPKNSTVPKLPPLFEPTIPAFRSPQKNLSRGFQYFFVASEV